LEPHVAGIADSGAYFSNASRSSFPFDMINVGYSINADAGAVEMIIAGEGEVPPMQELLSKIKSSAGRAEVTVNIVPRKRIKGSTTP
jgi:hypothetical protein